MMCPTTSDVTGNQYLMLVEIFKFINYLDIIHVVLKFYSDAFEVDRHLNRKKKCICIVSFVITVNSTVKTSSDTFVVFFNNTLSTSQPGYTMFETFNGIWHLSMFWSSTNKKLIELNNLQFCSTTSSKLEIHCTRAHPRGQTLRAGAALLIGQHSVSCPCVPRRWQIVAAASCLTIGNGPTEEVHVLLFVVSCFQRVRVDICGCGWVGGGSRSMSFPSLPFLPSWPPHGCQISFVSSSRLRTRPGATVMSLVTFSCMFGPSVHVQPRRRTVA